MNKPNRQGVICRLKSYLKHKDIDYETNYLTFEKNGTRYQVFRVDKDKRQYRLNIIKGNHCESEDYISDNYNELLQKINQRLEDTTNDND